MNDNVKIILNELAKGVLAMAKYYQVLVGPCGQELYVGSEKAFGEYLSKFQYPIYRVFDNTKDLEDWSKSHQAFASDQDKQVDGVVYCWCDGGTWIHAQKNHGTVSTDPAGWAYTIDLPTEPRSVDTQAGAELGATNNQMELTAVIKCLSRLLELKRQYDVIVIYLDSKYIYSAYTEGWVNNWKKNDWTGKADLKNKELWQKLDSLVQQFSDLSFDWVKGHTNSEGNQLVHELCQNTMAKLKK